MRVLVATNELQGLTPGDYAHAVAGELVTANVAECDCADCGCSHGFAGLVSHRATTTAMVVELTHVTTSDLREAIFDSLVTGGWLDLFSEVAGSRFDLPPEAEILDVSDLIDEPAEAMRELIDEHLDVIAFICNRFEPGTIVSRSGDLVWSREWPTAA